LLKFNLQLYVSDVKLVNSLHSLPKIKIRK
jgi:hypothetical protein